MSIAILGGRRGSLLDLALWSTPSLVAELQPSTPELSPLQALSAPW